MTATTSVTLPVWKQRFARAGEFLSKEKPALALTLLTSAAVGAAFGLGVGAIAGLCVAGYNFIKFSDSATKSFGALVALFALGVFTACGFSYKSLSGYDKALDKALSSETAVGAVIPYEIKYKDYVTGFGQEVVAKNAMTKAFETDKCTLIFTGEKSALDVHFKADASSGNRPTGKSLTAEKWRRCQAQ